MTTVPAEAPEPLLQVLDDLSHLMAQLELDDRTPTPCEYLNYSELLQHTIGWLNAFTDGLTYPAGRCSDPDDVVVMGDGAYQVQRLAQRLEDGFATLPADRPVWIGETQLPLEVVLSMMLLEFQLHGWDLARAGDLDWSPQPDGVEASLAFARQMISDDQRGPGLPFGDAVPVGPSAGPFEQLLGLCGRDPGWGKEPEPPVREAAPVTSPPAPGGQATAATAGQGPRVASGTFTVTDFAPQMFTPDVDTALDTGYTLMRKEFSGAVQGWAQTQFVSAFDAEQGRGSYLAMESFTGTVDGRQGTFNLAHSATTYGGTERVHDFVLIVPFSGTGDLSGITGTGAIRIDPDGTHHLHLYYQL